MCDLQEVRETSTTEEASAPRGGLPRGETWLVVTAGTSSSRRQLGGLAASMNWSHQRAGRYDGELDRGAGSGRPGPDMIDIAEGQPLRLKLIRAILQAADDPNRDFLLQAETGLPVTILEPLPRTPLAWVPNYASTTNRLDFAKS